MTSLFHDKRLPSKPNAATVSHAVSEDLAGQDSVAQKNGAKLLCRVSIRGRGRSGATYYFGQGLGQVGDVKISRQFVSLRFETRVEGLLESLSDGH